MLTELVDVAVDQTRTAAPDPVEQIKPVEMCDAPKQNLGDLCETSAEMELSLGMEDAPRVLPVVQQIVHYKAPWDAVPSEWKSRIDAAARISREEGEGEMSDRDKRILLKQIALGDCNGTDVMRMLEMIHAGYASSEDLVRRPDLVRVYESLSGDYDSNVVRRAVARAASISATQMEKDLTALVHEMYNKDDRRKGNH